MLTQEELEFLADALAQFCEDCDTSVEAAFAVDRIYRNISLPFQPVRATRLPALICFSAHEKSLPGR